MHTPTPTPTHTEMGVNMPGINYPSLISKKKPLVKVNLLKLTTYYVKLREFTLFIS